MGLLLDILKIMFPDGDKKEHRKEYDEPWREEGYEDEDEWLDDILMEEEEEEDERW
ncbi:MAG: hypothetical protein IKD71_00825 [Solobacterium sp.]|nr:hypothetical protein [Solobacterium sp.]